MFFSRSCTVAWFIYLFIYLFVFNFRPCWSNTKTTLPVLIKPQWFEKRAFEALRWLFSYSTCRWQPTCHHNWSSNSSWLHNLGSIQILQQLTWEMSTNVWGRIDEVGPQPERHWFATPCGSDYLLSVSDKCLFSFCFSAQLCWVHAGWGPTRHIYTQWSMCPLRWFIPEWRSAGFGL